MGVVLYCEESRFLDAAWQVDELRLTALDPGVDRAAVCRGLEFVAGVCRGDAALGEIAGKDLGVRFGFLKAPRSTVVQPGPGARRPHRRPTRRTGAPAGPARAMTLTRRRWWCLGG